MSRFTKKDVVDAMEQFDARRAQRAGEPVKPVSESFAQAVTAALAVAIVSVLGIIICRMLMATPREQCDLQRLAIEYLDSAANRCDFLLSGGWEHFEAVLYCQKARELADQKLNCY